VGSIMNELRQRSILLVDDETVIGVATKSRLERFGYNILLASCSEQAISLAREREEISLILMDIDLGKGPNGIETCKRILLERNIPIIFVSSHTESEIISLTEAITSYGYIVKSSHMTVYDASIKMAYKLFSERTDKTKYAKYLEVALENASEPIFITDKTGDIVFFNKAYLSIQGLRDPGQVEKKFSEYSKLIMVFSEDGEMLAPDDWASTRGLSGKSGIDTVFYVYHISLKVILMNQYTYAPICGENNEIIGSYVKIGHGYIEPDERCIKKIKEYAEKAYCVGDIFDTPNQTSRKVHPDES
jgi:CheY-like chemotaxis protein